MDMNRTYLEGRLFLRMISVRRFLRSRLSIESMAPSSLLLMPEVTGLSCPRDPLRSPVKNNQNDLKSQNLSFASDPNFS